MVIAIDFDGTCVTHEFPEVGKDIGSAKVLRELVDNGHKLILYTMRSHREVEGRDTLQEALDWFNDNGIELYGVNENPSQHYWTDSPKIYANLYIDDAALGCPKKVTEDGSIAVDWMAIQEIFLRNGIINTIIL